MNKKTILLLLLLTLFSIGGTGDGTSCSNASLSGKITDGTSAGIAGVVVSAQMEGSEEVIQPVISGADGRYSISDLSPGTYTVTASTGEYSSTKAAIIAETDGPGCPQTELNFIIGMMGQDKSFISWWNMDQSSGTAVNDTKGNNNGILGADSAAPAWDSSGKSGYCLHFDGNDYVNLGAFSKVTGDIDISVAMWIKFNSDDLNVTAQLVDCNYATNYVYKGFQLYVNCESGVKRIRFGCHQNDDVFGYVSASTDIGDNLWHFIAGVRDASGAGKFKLYIDDDVAVEGNSTTTGAIIDSVGNSHYSIGSHYAMNQGFFKGYIDEVMIFEKALSADEVSELYTQ